MFLFIIAGVFELAVVRMSRYFDVSQNAVLFLDVMLPAEAFLTTRDTAEMKLVGLIFDFAKSLAEMQLSEVTLALYSAYILLQNGEILNSRAQEASGIKTSVLFRPTRPKQPRRSDKVEPGRFEHAPAGADTTAAECCSQGRRLHHQQTHQQAAPTEASTFEFCGALHFPIWK